MTRKLPIHVGTSGWNYPHWKGPFYPDDLPDRDLLAFYRQRFDTVEINNSFYRLPSEKTLQNWRETAGSSFTFAVKASRYITHMKKLKDPEEPLDNFLKRIDTLGDTLGPVLFQLPPQWNCNPGRLRAFLEALPDGYRWVFEFRDESWWNDEVYALLRRHNAAFCFYELAGQEAPRVITADFVYVRLHGPGEKYQGSYDTDTLSGWIGAFHAWAGKARQIYCYFDNDENAWAAQNALRMKDMAAA